ncbi:hypothetical protein C0J50_15300 [Silurus asotus]|uniref:Uncharacterized protein n=1 Tax=Silurus asotus TaxID=30991 RepID=A0AAD5AZZ0_SILAS|nr:hypothetical protein C0J50_15300 [Silurus asotus]
MAELQTLNELDHLRNTEFGRPPPRHGLKLLYWFAKNCLSFDDNKRMCWRFDPDDGEYGFHLFENRYNINGDQLLPDKDLPYYEVGNLSKSGAGDLPKYVRKNYTSHHDESNKDRIIVSVDEEWFDEVYITEHQGQASYNADATYRISRGLLMIIQRLTLKGFLSDMDC